MTERSCPSWCIESHPADLAPDEPDADVWLHRSPATQIDIRADRDVFRSEWTSPSLEIYLATLDDPADDTRYQTVVEIAHGGVLLTLTAAEARELATTLQQHADRIVGAGKRRHRDR